MTLSHDAVVTFDYGTSGTKAIAKYREAAAPFLEVEKYWLMNPSVQETTKAHYEMLAEESEDYGHSPHSCGVSYCDPETKQRRYFQVGKDAETSGQLITNQRKFTSCIAKTLALLGYLAVEGFGQCDQVPLTIGMLLPFSEYRDKSFLLEWFPKVIQNFSYDGIEIRQIHLDRICVMPEGAGLYKEYSAHKVLICGHRDITVMSFGDRKLLIEQTRTFPDSGFHDFLNRIQFPLGNELKASQIIFNAGRKLDRSRLLALTQTKGNQELKQLTTAIADAQKTYWMRRYEELSSMTYEGDSAIVISGGTSKYFSQEITQFYRDKKLKCHWGKEVMFEFYERFNLKRKTALLLRFADCYAFYKTMPGVEPFVKAEVEVMSHG